MASYDQEHQMATAAILFSIDVILRQVISLATRRNSLPVGYINDLSPKQLRDIAADGQVARVALRQISTDLGMPLNSVDMPVSRIAKALLSDVLFSLQNLDSRELAIVPALDEGRRRDIVAKTVQIRTAIRQMSQVVDGSTSDPTTLS